MTQITSNEIQGLCAALLNGLNDALGDKLYGVYLYGALAFPEGGATGDIDFHVILTDPPDDREKAAVESLHGALARDYPPLGAEMDGYYILLEDARRTAPPRHLLLLDIVDNSWALHRAHIRAGRCIVLWGPDPRDVYPEASWSELVDALEGELEYVERHLADYPAYCVLNLCRLMFSFETRDVVVSKMAAARWAVAAFPRWQRQIEAAKRTYEGRATAEEQRLLEDTIGDLHRFACEQMAPSRGNEPGSC